MTENSSLAVAMIVSYSWVTYATTIKWLNMIPLKIIEYSLSNFYHMIDYLFICFHARNYFKNENMCILLICMLHVDIC